MAYRGKSLKALRESKRIRLRRIANETRISLSYLEDLEKERFDRFPGKFYFKSFAREYARALGLNPDEVLADLQQPYEDWSGESQLADTDDRFATVEDGLVNRIAGIIRGAQEI